MERKKVFLKIFLAVFSLAFIFSPGAGLAENTSLGLIFVEPYGVCAKFWHKPSSGLDLAAGWIPGMRKSFRFHGDFLLPALNLYGTEGADFFLYYGIGARMTFRFGTRAGIRFPVGVEIISKNLPLSFFFEAVPVLEFKPEVGFQLRGALGVRYLF